ncbi:PREDICTED: transmembrane protein 134 [Miniopterus natalensis]|uniref:transmembrane protein 134 n=1 Tax=Miniopterus natalensis TaxID=291302 RepID=UPI0007A721A4|nr:PREDICTED: transmembrane protein 134 [Miniopterus natalensis]
MLGALNQPLGSCPPKPPAPSSYLVSVCDSSHPVIHQTRPALPGGGGWRGQVSSCQPREAAAWAGLALSPGHGGRKGLSPVSPEPRVLEQNLENDEDGAQAPPEPDGGVSTRDSGRTSVRSSQWSFSTISNSTQRSYNACCSWTQHPLIQKNRRVVLASFLLLLLGLVLILTGVGLEVAPENVSAIKGLGLA